MSEKRKQMFITMFMKSVELRGNKIQTEIDFWMLKTALAFT